MLRTITKIYSVVNIYFCTGKSSVLFLSPVFDKTFQDIVRVPYTHAII